MRNTDPGKGRKSRTVPLFFDVFPVFLFATEHYLFVGAAYEVYPVGGGRHDPCIDKPATSSPLPVINPKYLFSKMCSMPANRGRRRKDLLVELKKKGHFSRRFQILFIHIHRYVHFLTLTVVMLDCDANHKGSSHPLL